MNKTILILAANDQNASLLSLAEETNSIQYLLNKAANNRFQAIPIFNATIQHLIKELSVADRSIEIIHFAGHADSQSLQFTNNPIDADALAEKLKIQNTVKLVFLNGCATKEQVHFFHKADIPFVIATTKPVEDKKAAWLAQQFYHYLLVRGSVKKAMEEVYIDTSRLTKEIEFGGTRGIILSPQENPLEQIEWGLYINPDIEDTIDYQLIEPIESKQHHEISQTVFLDELLASLEEVDATKLGFIHNMLNDLDAYADNKKTIELLKVLPYPLGIRLEQIKSTDQEDKAINGTNDHFLGVDRVKQLLLDYIHFFESLLHQTTALLLAQMWQDQEIALSRKEEKSSLIWSFIEENRIVSSPSSYKIIIPLIHSWIKAYDASKVAYISDNLLTYLQSEEFEKASNFFFLQKQYLKNEVRLTVSEFIGNCFVAQKYIYNAFPHFNYLLKFTYASIRGVNIQNFRHLPSDFKSNIQNEVSTLIVNDNYQVPVAGSLDLGNLMENKMVLAFYDTDPGIGSDSLNMFPFYIDRNVFSKKKTELPDIYFFTGFFISEEDSAASYHFASMTNPAKIWKFNPAKSKVANFLHIGEPSDEVHEENHLMHRKLEFKNYLKPYMHFLQQFKE